MRSSAIDEPGLSVRAFYATLTTTTIFIIITSSIIAVTNTLATSNGVINDYGQRQDYNQPNKQIHFFHALTSSRWSSMSFKWSPIIIMIWAQRKINLQSIEERSGSLVSCLVTKKWTASLTSKLPISKFSNHCLYWALKISPFSISNCNILWMFTQQKSEPFQP